MASLKDIRRRIGSVKNTQQITKAMKVVAASKLRRATMAIAGARPFAQKLEELLGRLLREIMQTEGVVSGGDLQALAKLHPLLSAVAVEGDAKKKVALLVVSSDRGLCGAYNSNVIKAAWRRYQELLSTSSNEVQVYFAGRRGQDFFAKRGVQGTWFDDLWQGKLTVAKSDKVARIFTDKFLKGELQEVNVVFTEFRSAISQSVALKQLLPLSISFENKEASTVTTKSTEASSAPYIYEPDRKTLLAGILPKQVQTQFYRIFADSLASELGAKMTAMDNATRNAGDMISSLTLQANRIRQASITTELMEIIGGAEALKG